MNLVHFILVFHVHRSCKSGKCW